MPFKHLLCFLGLYIGLGVGGGCLVIVVVIIASGSGIVYYNKVSVYSIDFYISRD